MNLNKLARQLRREATVHPKKAAVLALLLLVALYYWGPLVWGWVAPEQASGQPPAAETEASAEPGALVDSASTPPQAPPEERTRLHHWTQLDEWIRQDPMTAPVDDADLAGWRNPFAVALVDATGDQQEAAESLALQVTPESLGMKLSGTLVGSRRRVALIGGKAYREGQTIRIEQADQPIELRLVEVHPQRIVLEWEGNRLDLAIPQGKTVAGIQAGEKTP